MKDIFKKPMETILEYEGFSFYSEIEVDDMKLAWELLSRTLDDDRLRLLETTREMLAYDDCYLLGDEKEVYAVITFGRRFDSEGKEYYEPEFACVRDTIAEAVDAYNGLDEECFGDCEACCIVRALVEEDLGIGETREALMDMVRMSNVNFLAIKTYK